ncbi:MAG: pyridoxal phosphate-dependent decarboxylase family protein [Balneolaceae bacterium]
MNHYQSYLNQLKKALDELDKWRSSYGEAPEFQHNEIPDELILKLAERLKGNYPFHHARYAGQMLKPPHPVAWLAYSLAMTINPNNHALDGGPPTSEMEKEVTGMLAEMVGYGDNYLGHLTSGGTIANLEALFVAREIHPEKAIASSANAHYTHARVCQVLGVKHITVPVDTDGVPDHGFIQDHSDEIGTLVVTPGTTGLGTTEPVHSLMDAASSTGIRVHLDAAYGGFFKLLQGSGLIDDQPWERFSEADSIVIDPHKHGLQPYGCGSVLFKDPAVGKYYKHNSPYTYFTSDDLHLGEISLECSRAGASAAALWTTLQLLPLQQSNGLGPILKSCRRAALNFYDRIEHSKQFDNYHKPDLDITAYFPITEERSISSISELSRKIFQYGMNQKENGFYLSLYKLPADLFLKKFPEFAKDSDVVTILRSVFMKPEHEPFIPALVDLLEEAAVYLK